MRAPLLALMLTKHARCCASTHSRDDKTFKPKRSFLQGSSRDRLHEYVVKTLGSGDLRQSVKLPEGENLYEWLAVNSAFASRQAVARGDGGRNACC